MKVKAEKIKEHRGSDIVVNGSNRNIPEEPRKET